MKPNRKSAFLSGCTLVLLAAGLGGCEDISLPRIYGPNEIPLSVRDASTPLKVPTPDENSDTYPRLGDVPSYPKDFSPQKSIDQTKVQMDANRRQADTLRQQMQNAPGKPVLAQ